MREKGKYGMLRVLVLLQMCALLLCISCNQGKKDPGPFVIDGWIERCESRCDQMEKCNYDQFLFDHGDWDNCYRACESRLTGDMNMQFIEQTPDACLQALYSDVKCVFGLQCEDLAAWKNMSPDDYPCSSEDNAANNACEGSSTEDFLDDCGFPVETYPPE